MQSEEALVLVLQVFSWLEARLCRTQRRATLTRKRMNRFKSSTIFGEDKIPVFGLFVNEIHRLIAVRVRKEPAV